VVLATKTKRPPGQPTGRRDPGDLYKKKYPLVGVFFLDFLGGS